MPGRDPRVREALERERTVDITTIGRRTGRPRRIEIWFYNVEGRLYITGTPGRRNWYANLLSNPDFTFHLKGRVQADLPAKARPIREEAERRAILTRLVPRLGGRHLEAWVERSPLVEVRLEEG